MLKAEAIKKAGGVTNLSAIFGITKSAVSQWPDGPLPEARLYELRGRRPDWFATSAAESVSASAAAAAIANNEQERAESLALAAANGVAA